MEDKIFHATFRIQDTVIMASDVGSEKPQLHATVLGVLPRPANAVAGQSPTGVRCFAEIQGQVIIPLAPSPFTSWYGIVVDRFGLSWKFNVNTEDSCGGWKLHENQ